MQMLQVDGVSRCLYPWIPQMASQIASLVLGVDTQRFTSVHAHGIVPLLTGMAGRKDGSTAAIVHRPARCVNSVLAKPVRRI